MIIYARQPWQIVPLVFEASAKLWAVIDTTDVAGYHESVFYSINISNVLNTIRNEKDGP